MKEVIHFNSPQERLDFLKGKHTEVIPTIAKPTEVIPKIAEEAVKEAKPKKKAKKKKEKKDDEVQAE